MLARALATVFLRPWYSSGALLTAAAIYTTAVLTPNLALLARFVSEPLAELKLVSTLLLASPASHGWVSAASLMVTSLLCGMVASMLVYAWRHQPRRSWGAWSASGGGALAALFGIGCLACGPLLLGSLLALIGASGLLLALPLHGAEFSLLAIALLGYAIYALGKVIGGPRVC